MADGAGGGAPSGAGPRPGRRVRAVPAPCPQILCQQHRYGGYQACGPLLLQGPRLAAAAPALDDPPRRARLFRGTAYAHSPPGRDRHRHPLARAAASAWARAASPVWTFDDSAAWRRPWLPWQQIPNVVPQGSPAGSSADRQWTQASIGPWIRECISRFGADRCMSAPTGPRPALAALHRPGRATGPSPPTSPPRTPPPLPWNR